ncbi:GNAT family N-acetyltransferase [Paracoccus aestuariivivens]|uniref:L-ornithine N(alpha)-acyltransferase n=1 Tax=Paracoccus aestuariivivens TaxID=1820333 RepID=A0A6L6JAR5_9RHOB|nr:GNAT family N-acyltransferase [Paracoccus aestuariivivens]MTH78636.1 GNAT family N-acetyltransferase [Paracoccus aestuariivivens]
MMALRKGRYEVRTAEGPDDVREAQRLRWLCFVGRRGDLEPAGDQLDADDYDSRCTHVLIREQGSGQLVACFRMLTLSGGSQIGESYSARYYNLSRLQDFHGKMVEIGRFCIHPERQDPDILRLAWGALARHVDEQGVEMLFGCSSFIGTDTHGYEDAFAMLRERHLAPKRWLPRVKAPNVFRFARALRLRKPDPRRAMAAMPPLLRSYLAMGGWVSDHAVVDQQLNTLHVFTGLEIRAIPPARARLLRAAGA